MAMMLLPPYFRNIVARVVFAMFSCFYAIMCWIGQVWIGHCQHLDITSNMLSARKMCIQINQVSYSVTLMSDSQLN